MSDLSDFDDYGDEAYFEQGRDRQVFDSALLRQPASVLPTRKPLTFAPEHTVTDAIRQMQAEHRGVVVVTVDGTPCSAVKGIFTERDVLFRIVDRGRNPAVLPLSEVMTPDPERLRDDQTIAEVLNMMSVGGFRHIPVVDANDHLTRVVSVRDVVEFLVEKFPREVLNLSSSAGQRAREGA